MLAMSVIVRYIIVITVIILDAALDISVLLVHTGYNRVYATSVLVLVISHVIQALDVKDVRESHVGLIWLEIVVHLVR
jgi:hypothetical protein